MISKLFSATFHRNSFSKPTLQVHSSEARFSFEGGGGAVIGVMEFKIK